MSRDKLAILSQEAMQQDKEAKLTCLSLVDGAIPPSAVPLAIKGQCDQCGEGIFHASTAPTSLTKICCACTLAEIEAQGEAFQWAVSEQSVKEALHHFGYPDTPDMREKILNVSKRRFIEWLREHASKQQRHTKSCWE